MTVHYFCSIVADGSMKSADKSYMSVLPVREKFLESHDISPDQTTLVQVIYEGNDYCRYFSLDEADKGDGIIRPATIAADALVISRTNHALFLPLADCIGAVIHDPTKNLLMLSHLGRHNLVRFGGTRCIEYLVDKHRVNPSDLTIWLSPAAGKDNYPLHAFHGRSMHDVATEQLIASGVHLKKISASPIDSSVDPEYFSHSQYLKGNRLSDGRFAIVAIMTE